MNSAKRAMIIYRRLLDGDKYSPGEILNYLEDRFGGAPVLRTIQRDLENLAKTPELGIEYIQRGNEKYYYVASDFKAKSGIPLNFKSSDLLSIYVLKAFLKTFKGTEIENMTNNLLRSISKIAPEDVVFEDDLIWDKNIGNYDYSEKSKIIDKLIESIKQKDLVRVKYRKAGREEIRQFEVFFRQIYTYFGLMYVIAYVPSHKNDISLAIHWIEDFNILDNDENIKLPPFDKAKFSRNRFGVIESNPVEIKLKISGGMGKYFYKRFWHETARVTTEGDELFLEMKAPITPELVSWVLSWTGTIEVIKPKELREKVVTKLERCLRLYEKELAP